MGLIRWPAVRSHTALLPSPRVEAALSLALLLMLLANAGLFLRIELESAMYPYQLDYGEGAVLYEVLRQSQGLPIYKDVATRPWIFNNYTPLHTLVLTPTIGAFGLTYWPGRVLSLAATAGSSVLIALIVHQTTRNKFSSIVAGLIFLAFEPVRKWAVLVKPDDLALVLSLAGLFVVTWRPHGLTLMLSALLFALAAFTKQSFVFAGPLAASVFLVTRSPARAAQFGAAFIGLLVAAGLAAQALSAGWFWFDVVTSHSTIYSTRAFLRWVRMLFTEQWLLFGAVVVVLVAQSKPPYRSPLPVYIALATATLLTVGRVGANVNYFLEFEAAAAIALGIALAHGVRVAAGGKFVTWRVTLALLCVQIALLVYPVADQARGWSSQMNARLLRDADMDRYIASTRGPVIGDDVMGTLALAGRNVEIEPFQYTQLALSGKWDQTPFLEAIVAREFEAIMIAQVSLVNPLEALYTPKMLEAISQSYRPAGRVGTAVLWLPKTPNSARETPRPSTLLAGSR